MNTVVNPFRVECDRFTCDKRSQIVAANCDNSAIAVILNENLSTVKRHKKNISRSLVEMIGNEN